MRGNGAIYPGYLLFIALDEYQLLLLSRERNKLYIMRPAFLVFFRKVFHMQRHSPTNDQSRYIEHIEKILIRYHVLLLFLPFIPYPSLPISTLLAPFLP